MATLLSVGDVIKIPPVDIVYTLAGAGDETAGIMSGAYDRDRVRLDETDKHRSMVQRYVEGRRWEETDLFVNIYARRFAEGQRVRGCDTIEQLAAQYYGRVDDLFADMKARGFRAFVDGRAVPLPNLHIGHDCEPLIGNNGNHRVAMAQILRLPFVVARIQSQHAKAVGRPMRTGAIDMDTPQKLPEGATTIPAMTTEAERLAYWRLAREQAQKGAVIELGAWLGASTVYIAAGVRDSGAREKVHVYDRFVWDPSHERKVIAWHKDHPSDGYRAGPMPNRATMLDTFKQNLGALLPFVEVNQAEIKSLKWRRGPVALLVCDAPKRVKEISSVLGELAPALVPGSRMAWQDFAHFPSYEIVACLTRLLDRGYVKFDEGVSPGTTAIFTVVKPWNPATVSESALALQTWNAGEVKAAWEAWVPRLPDPMRPRFRCGAAMFLCDIGAAGEGKKLLAGVLKQWPAEVLPKWRYLAEHRQNLAARYTPLFDVIEA